jgi:hypothetical protein
VGFASTSLAAAVLADQVLVDALGRHPLVELGQDQGAERFAGTAGRARRADARFGGICLQVTRNGVAVYVQFAGHPPIGPAACLQGKDCVDESHFEPIRREMTSAAGFQLLRLSAELPPPKWRFEAPLTGDIWPPADTWPGAAALGEELASTGPPLCEAAASRGRMNWSSRPDFCTTHLDPVWHRGIMYRRSLTQPSFGGSLAILETTAETTAGRASPS